MLRTAFILLLLGAALLPAQRNEISLQFGTTLTQRRELNVPEALQSVIDAAVLREDNGLAGGIVYRVRLWSNDVAAISAEVPLFVVQATTNDLIPAAARSFFSNTSGASAFLTPGAVVQLAPNSPVVPFALFGVGYARVFEADVSRALPLRVSFADKGTWALNYGGGADLHLFRHLGIRVELRNFRTGGSSPLDPLLGVVRQRNTLLLTGGLVFRF